jgi:hypothetical protein
VSDRYAARTKVPADRTRLEIEALMRKRGADQFFSGADKERAVLAFRAKGRHMRFTLPLAGARSEQMIRSRWRALLLVIKARLEAIDLGIMGWEDAFLADIILPDKRTVAEVMRPQIEAAYSTGKMPPLLGYDGPDGDFTASYNPPSGSETE